MAVCACVYTDVYKYVHVCMCVYTCVYKCVDMGVYVFVCSGECGAWRKSDIVPQVLSSLFLETRCLTNPPIWLDWLAIEAQGFACLCPYTLHH